MHEPDPFRAIYDAYHDRVRRFVARIVGPHDADDVTQVVFSNAAKALPAFRGDADVSTWLYRIASNAASDWLNSRSAQERRITVSLPVSEDDDGAALIGAAAVDRRPTPEDELSHQDMRDCIRGEIGKLTESHREVFMLSALGGLGDDEIAQVLGVSKGTAKVRLHRARQEFRNIIAARCDFYRDELSCKPSSPECCQPAAGSHSHRP
jgi:RNA polymerase sigma-70 factor, ECF subfamily